MITYLMRMDGRRKHAAYPFKVYGAQYGDHWSDRIIFRATQVEINLPRMKAYKPYKILSTRLKIRKHDTCMRLDNRDLALLQFGSSTGLMGDVEKIYFFLEELEDA